MKANFKTLQNIAREKNLFTADQIPTHYLQPQKIRGSLFNYSEYVNSVKDVEFLEYIPKDILSSFTYGVFFHCYEQKKNFSDEIELYVIDRNVSILFLTPEGNAARISSHKNKFSFNLAYFYFREFDSVSYHLRQKALNDSGIKEPNSIGVFSVKKISNWLNYCDAYHNTMRDLLDSSNDKNKEIESKIENFIKQAPGCNVSKWDNKTSVRVKDLFEVVFEHNKTTCHLYTKISFLGNESDILRILNN
jgi:hypothetical protein